MKIVQVLFRRFTIVPRAVLSKVVAIATLVSFLLTGVFGQAIAALSQEEQERGRFKQVYSDYVLPATKGRITAGKYYGSDTVVINIQDLHCHPEVQRNISAILGTLSSKYALSRIYLEGASGAVDLRCYTCIPDPKVRGKVLESLLKKGDLTGVEYFSAESEKNIPVFGLENETLYDENSLRLGRIRGNSEDIQELLKGVSSNLESVKEKYYNSRQKNLEKIVTKYRTGKLDTRKFYTLLKKHGEGQGIDVSRYTSLTGFLSLLELEKSLNYKRITLQMSRLLADLRRLLPYTAYNSILLQTDNFAKTDELYRLLAQVTATYGIPVGKQYPDLARFFDYLNTSRNMNPLSLLREEHLLTAEIRLSMAKNKSEREVAFLLDNYRRLDDFLNAKISADDYAGLMRNIGKFKVLYACYAGDNAVEELGGYCELLEKYYQVNLSRNESFIQNMLGNTSEAGTARPLCANGENIAQVVASLATAKEIVVVVTGGFHSSGIARLLNQRRISHLEITPNTTDDTRFADAVYWEKLGAQNRILSQAFALKVLAAQPREAQLARTAGTYLSVLVEQGVTAGEIQAEMQKYLDGWYQSGNVTFTFSGRDSDDADMLRFKLRFGNGKEYSYGYNTKTGEAAIRSKSPYSRYLRRQSFRRLLSSVISVAAVAALSHIFNDPYAGTLFSGILGAGLPGIIAAPGTLSKKITSTENKPKGFTGRIVPRAFLREYDEKLPGEWVVNVYDTIDDEALSELKAQVEKDITPLGMTVSTLEDVKGYYELPGMNVQYRKRWIKMRVFAEPITGNDNRVKGAILHFVIPEDATLDKVPSGEDEETWKFIQKSQIMVLTARAMIAELTNTKRRGMREELEELKVFLPQEPALIKLFGPGAGLLADVNDSVRYATSNDMNQVSDKYLIVANTDYKYPVSKNIAQLLGLKELSFEGENIDRDLNRYGMLYASKVQPGNIRKVLAAKRNTGVAARKKEPAAKKRLEKIFAAVRHVRASSADGRAESRPAASVSPHKDDSIGIADEAGKTGPAPVTREFLAEYDKELAAGEWVVSVYDTVDATARAELQAEIESGILPLAFTMSTMDEVLARNYIGLGVDAFARQFKRAGIQLQIYVEPVVGKDGKNRGAILHLVGPEKDIYTEKTPSGEDDELWKFVQGSQTMILGVRSILLTLTGGKGSRLRDKLAALHINLPKEPALIKLIGPGAGLLSNVKEATRVGSRKIEAEMNQISNRFTIVATTDDNKKVTKPLAQRRGLKELSGEGEIDRDMNIYPVKYANKVKPQEIKKVLATMRSAMKAKDSRRDIPQDRERSRKGEKASGISGKNQPAKTAPPDSDTSKQTSKRSYGEPAFGGQKRETTVGAHAIQRKPKTGKVRNVTSKVQRTTTKNKERPVMKRKKTPTEDPRKEVIGHLAFASVQIGAFIRAVRQRGWRPVLWKSMGGFLKWHYARLKGGILVSFLGEDSGLTVLQQFKKDRKTLTGQAKNKIYPVGIKHFKPDDINILDFAEKRGLLPLSHYLTADEPGFRPEDIKIRTAKRELRNGSVVSQFILQAIGHPENITEERMRQIAHAKAVVVPVNDAVLSTLKEEQLSEILNTILALPWFYKYVDGIDRWNMGPAVKDALEDVRNPETNADTSIKALNRAILMKMLPDTLWQSDISITVLGRKIGLRVMVEEIPVDDERKAVMFYLVEPPRYRNRYGIVRKEVQFLWEKALEGYILTRGGMQLLWYFRGPAGKFHQYMQQTLGTAGEFNPSHLLLLGAKAFYANPRDWAEENLNETERGELNGIDVIAAAETGFRLPRSIIKALGLYSDGDGEWETSTEALSFIENDENKYVPVSITAQPDIPDSEVITKFQDDDDAVELNDGDVDREPAEENDSFTIDDETPSEQSMSTEAQAKIEEEMMKKLAGHYRGLKGKLAVTLFGQSQTGTAEEKIAKDEKMLGDQGDAGMYPVGIGVLKLKSETNIAEFAKNNGLESYFKYLDDSDKSPEIPAFEFSLHGSRINVPVLVKKTRIDGNREALMVYFIMPEDLPYSATFKGTPLQSVADRVVEGQFLAKATRLLFNDFKNRFNKHLRDMVFEVLKFESDGLSFNPAELIMIGANAASVAHLSAALGSQNERSEHIPTIRHYAVVPDDYWTPAEVYTKLHFLHGIGKGLIEKASNLLYQVPEEQKWIAGAKSGLPGLLVKRNMLKAYDEKFTGRNIFNVFTEWNETALGELWDQAAVGAKSAGVVLDHLPANQDIESYAQANGLQRLPDGDVEIQFKNQPVRLPVLYEVIADPADENKKIAILHIVDDPAVIKREGNPLPSSDANDTLWNDSIDTMLLSLAAHRLIAQVSDQKRGKQNRILLGLNEIMPDVQLIKLIGRKSALVSNDYYGGTTEKNAAAPFNNAVIAATNDEELIIPDSVAAALGLRKPPQHSLDVQEFVIRYHNKVKPSGAAAYIKKLENQRRTRLVRKWNLAAMLPFAFFAAAAASALIRHFVYGETDFGGAYGLVSAMSFAIIPRGDRPDKRKKYQRRKVKEDASVEEAGNEGGPAKIVAWRSRARLSSQGKEETIEKATAPEKKSAIVVERKKLRKYYESFGRKGTVSISVYGAIDDEAYDELRMLAEKGGHPIALALRNESSNRGGEKKLLTVPVKVQIVFRGKPIDIDVYEEQLETADDRQTAAIYYFSTDNIDRSRKPDGASVEEWNTAINAQVLALASHQFMMQLQAKSTHVKPRPLVRFVSSTLKIKPEEFHPEIVFLIDPEAALLANVNEATREMQIRANLNRHVKLQGNKAEPEKRMPFVSTLTDSFLSWEVYGPHGLNIAAADYVQKDPVTGAFNLGRYPGKYTPPAEDLLGETDTASADALSEEPAATGPPVIPAAGERSVLKDLSVMARYITGHLPSQRTRGRDFDRREAQRKMRDSMAEISSLTVEQFFRRFYLGMKNKLMVTIAGESFGNTGDEATDIRAILTEQVGRDIYAVGVDLLHLSEEEAADIAAYAAKNNMNLLSSYSGLEKPERFRIITAYRKKPIEVQVLVEEIQATPTRKALLFHVVMPRKVVGSDEDIDEKAIYSGGKPENADEELWNYLVEGQFLALASRAIFSLLKNEKYFKLQDNLSALLGRGKGMPFKIDRLNLIGNGAFAADIRQSSKHFLKIVHNVFDGINMVAYLQSDPWVPQNIYEELMIRQGRGKGMLLSETVSSVPETNKYVAPALDEPMQSKDPETDSKSMQQETSAQEELLSVSEVKRTDMDKYDEYLSDTLVFSVYSEIDDAVRSEMGKQVERKIIPVAVSLLSKRKHGMQGDTLRQLYIGNRSAFSSKKPYNVSVSFRGERVEMPVFIERMRISDSTDEYAVILYLDDSRIDRDNNPLNKKTNESKKLDPAEIKKNNDLWDTAIDAQVLALGSYRIIRKIGAVKNLKFWRALYPERSIFIRKPALVKLIGPRAALLAYVRELSGYYKEINLDDLYFFGTTDYTDVIPQEVNDELRIRAYPRTLQLNAYVDKYANSRLPSIGELLADIEVRKSAMVNGNVLRPPLTDRLMNIFPFIAAFALIASVAHLFSGGIDTVSALLSMQVAAVMPLVTRKPSEKAGKGDALRKGDDRLKGELALLFAERVNEPVKRYMEEMSDAGSFPIVMTHLTLPENKDIFAYAGEHGLKHFAELKGEQAQPGMQPEIVFSYGKKEKGKKPQARLYILVETVPFANGRNGLVFYYVDAGGANQSRISNGRKSLLPVSHGIMNKGQILAEAGRTTMTVLERNQAVRDEIRSLLGMDSDAFNETAFFTVLPPQAYSVESMKKVTAGAKMQAAGADEGAVMRHEVPEKDEVLHGIASSSRQEDEYAFFSRFDDGLNGKVSITVASHADQALRDHLSRRAAKGVLSIGMALLKDLDTEKRITLTGPIFSIDKMPYRDQTITMNVYAQTLPNNALMLYFDDAVEDPLKSINRDGMPEGEDPALWEYAIDSQVLVMVVDKTLAKMRSINVEGGKDVQAQISDLLNIPAREFKPAIIELVGGKAVPLADFHPYFGKKRLRSYAKNNNFAAAMDREIVIPWKITSELKIKQGEYYRAGLPLITLLEGMPPENKQIPQESNQSTISSIARGNTIKPIEKITLADRDKAESSGTDADNRERFLTISRKDLGKYNEKMAGGIGISVYSEVDDTARDELKAEVNAGVNSIAITLLPKGTDMQKFIIENRKKDRVITPLPKMNLKLRYRKKNITLNVYREIVYPDKMNHRKRAVILYVVDENNEIYRGEYPFNLVKQGKEMEKIWDYAIDSQVLALSVREIISNLSYNMNFRKAISDLLGLQYMKFIPLGMKLIGPKASLAADPNAAVNSYKLNYFQDFPIIATNDEVYKIPRPFVDVLKMDVTHFVNNWYDLSYFASVLANGWETPEERRRQTSIWETLHSELNLYSVFALGALGVAVALLSQSFLPVTVGTLGFSALSTVSIGLVWMKKETVGMSQNPKMVSKATFTRKQVYEFLDKYDETLKGAISFYVFGERLLPGEKTEEMHEAQLKELERQLKKRIFPIGVRLGDTGRKGILRYTEENGYEPLSNYMNTRSRQYEYTAENISVDAARRIIQDEDNPLSGYLREKFVTEKAITADALAAFLNSLLMSDYIVLPGDKADTPDEVLNSLFLGKLNLPPFEKMNLNRDALDAMGKLNDKDKYARLEARKTVRRAVIQKLIPGITQQPEITVDFQGQKVPLNVLLQQEPAHDGSDRNALMLTVVVPPEVKLPPVPDGVSEEEWTTYVRALILGLAARKIYGEIDNRNNEVIRKNVLALLGMPGDKFKVKKLKLVGEYAIMAGNLRLATGQRFHSYDFEGINAVAAMRTPFAVARTIFEKASKRTIKLEHIPADYFFQREGRDEKDILFPGFMVRPFLEGTWDTIKESNPLSVIALVVGAVAVITYLLHPAISGVGDIVGFAATLAGMVWMGRESNIGREQYGDDLADGGDGEEETVPYDGDGTAALQEEFSREQVYAFLDRDDDGLRGAISYYVFGERRKENETREEREKAQYEELGRQRDKGIFTVGVELGSLEGKDILEYTEENGYEPLSDYMNAKSIHYRYTADDVNIAAAKKVFDAENNPVAGQLRKVFNNDKEAMTADTLAAALNEMLTTAFPMPSIEGLHLNRDAMDKIRELNDRNKDVRKAAHRTVKRAVIQKLVPGITQKPEITIAYKKQQVPLYVLVKKLPADDGSGRNALMFTVVVPPGVKFPSVAPAGMSGEEWENYVYAQALGLAARKIHNEIRDRHSAILRKNILALLGMPGDEFEVKKLKLAGENAVLAANLPLATSNIFKYKYFDFENIDTIAAMRTALAVPRDVFMKASRRTTRLAYVTADVFFRRHRHNEMDILFPGSKARPVAPGGNGTADNAGNATPESGNAAPGTAGGAQPVTRESLEDLNQYLSGQDVINVYQTYDDRAKKEVKKQLLSGIRTVVIVHDRVPDGMTISGYARKNGLIRIDKIPIMSGKRLKSVPVFSGESDVSVLFRKRARSFPLYVEEFIVRNPEGKIVGAPVIHVIDDGVSAIKRSARPGKVTVAKWNDMLDTLILSHAAHRIITMLVSGSTRYSLFQKLVASLTWVSSSGTGAAAFNPALIKLIGFKAAPVAHIETLVNAGKKHSFKSTTRHIPFVATNDEEFAISGDEAALIGLGEAVDTQAIVAAFANTVTPEDVKTNAARPPSSHTGYEESEKASAAEFFSAHWLMKFSRRAVAATRGVSPRVLQALAAGRLRNREQAFLGKHAPEFYDRMSVTLLNAADAGTLAEIARAIQAKEMLPERLQKVYEERERLKESLRAQTGLGMNAVAMSLLHGDAETISRLPDLSYAFSFPLWYKGMYHEMQVYSEEVTVAGQRALILSLVDAKGTIPRYDVPGEENGGIGNRAIDSAVLPQAANEMFARIGSDEIVGRIISERMHIPYNRDTLQPAIVYLGGAEAASVAAMLDADGFGGDSLFDRVPVIARFDDDMALSPEIAGEILPGIPLNNDGGVSMRALAGSFADGLLPSAAGAGNVRKMLPGIPDDLLKQVWSVSPVSREKLAVLLGSMPFRRKKFQERASAIKPGIILNFSIKDLAAAPQNAGAAPLKNLKTKLDELASLGPAIALVDDLLDPLHPEERGIPKFNRTYISPVSSKGQYVDRDMTKAAEAAIENALIQKGKARGDIDTLFTYPVDTEGYVSPEAVQRMFALGFSGVLLDFTNAAQLPDVKSLTTIRAQNPDSIVLVAPPAGNRYGAELQNRLKEAQLPATFVEPYHLGSGLDVMRRNQPDTGWRVYLPSGDTSSVVPDAGQMEAWLTDVIDSRARYVILPYEGLSGDGETALPRLVINDMLARLIARRANAGTNIALREDRAFRGGAAAAGNLPVDADELRAVLDDLRDMRTLELPDGHVITSHGLNMFPAIRSYLSGAGENGAGRQGLTELLFREFDAVVENNEALRTGAYWQGMIEAVGTIRKRNSSDDAGLILLAYLDGFMQETLALAYPKDGPFENAEYEALGKEIFLEVDSLLVTKKGRHTVVSGAQNNEDWETFMNMKTVEYLVSIGRADFAEKLLIDTARSIYNEEFSGALGSPMFVEAVARYLVKKDLSPQDLRSVSPVLTQRQLQKRENREFLLTRYGNAPSILDAVKKVMKDYKTKETLTIGEQAYYRNAAKITEKIIDHLASYDRELPGYAPIVSNVSAGADEAIRNWRDTWQPDRSTEDMVRNHLFASATLSHNGDMLTVRELEQLMRRFNSVETKRTMFFPAELQTMKIPEVVRKNLSPRKTENEIRTLLQPLLNVHAQYGTIPLALATDEESDVAWRTPSPIALAGLLEILRIWSDPKVAGTVIKAVNLSIEANKAILYAS